MARTKGALGRKTIEKLKAEGKWPIDKNTKNKNTVNKNENNKYELKVQNPNTVNKVPLAERLKKNPELRKKREKFHLNPETGHAEKIEDIKVEIENVELETSDSKDFEKINDNKTSISKEINDIKSENFEPLKDTDGVIPESEEPKINDYKSLKNQKSKTKDSKSQPKKESKPITPKSYCDRCHEPIYCDPFKIDTNVVTSRADYHRQTTRFVYLCGKCSLELSNLVDNWLLEGGCYRKFGDNKSNEDEVNVDSESSSDSDNLDASNSNNGLSKDLNDSDRSNTEDISGDVNVSDSGDNDEFVF